MFSMFRSPGDEDFATGGQLEVRVSERTSSAAVRDLFDIRFVNVPKDLKLFLQGALVPSDAEKRLFGGLTLLPVLVGVVEPVIVGVMEASPVPKALYLLEQGAVALFRYYDFCDGSINTKIGASVLVPGPRGGDPEGGNPGVHEQDLGVRQTG
ncbi:hypothetical protein BJX68DRAFT_152570 [Aspergillus pseudodeflectus]|uniref:Uncharacterized protein n=1 Tax=Aspergillus pseudodeflectus TaxID=176178 RepID=A0ABR4JYL9_9EURO